jgi:hypothetical protein
MLPLGIPLLLCPLPHLGLFVIGVIAELVVCSTVPMIKILVCCSTLTVVRIELLGLLLLFC